MSIQVFDSIAALRAALANVRQAGSTIGFVPTMGALHAGHGRLIEQAARETDCVVVSIFVNPIQFNDQQDYRLYPRDLAADVDSCAALGARIVFAPSAAEMYPQPPRSFVEVSGVSECLCGEFRPGHFRGVATVVLKLFQIVQPERAYFGEKDAQQLAVIERMVSDLNIPVAVVGVLTVREPDGLALSSRNQRLSPEERRIAPVFFQALQAARERIAAGAQDAGEVRRAALAVLGRQPHVRVEYLEIVDPAEMKPVDPIQGPVRVAGAVWLGSTRLIDNVLCLPGGLTPAR